MQLFRTIYCKVSWVDVSMLRSYGIHILHLVQHLHHLIFELHFVRIGISTSRNVTSIHSLIHRVLGRRLADAHFSGN